MENMLVKSSVFLIEEQSIFSVVKCLHWSSTTSIKQSEESISSKNAYFWPLYTHVMSVRRMLSGMKRENPRHSGAIRLYEVCKLNNETGNVAPDLATLRRRDLKGGRWFKAFSEGIESIQDEPRSGRDLEGRKFKMNYSSFVATFLLSTNEMNVMCTNTLVHNQRARTDNFDSGIYKQQYTTRGNVQHHGSAAETSPSL
ncbi:hypothetical protein NQ318_021863 [Aromia moschata]|uniref:Uncharacterized protein n=1 Tax=Aromia moschata TaxID=1265417 RepID=A0AAV8Z9A4_9CUCU|nr:hypothetical protein NQ318_021863 [Aromia moschata]